MIRRIEWSAGADRDFDDAIAYIAFDSEKASLLVAQRIFEAVESLAEMPTGHPGRVKGTYEKLVRKTQYIIAYALTDETVNIVRIIHAARDWLEDEWPAE